MSTTTATTPNSAPTQGKKKLIIIVMAVVLLVGAGAAWFFMSQRAAYDEDSESRAAAVVPTFMPLESMVVNLADPGGDRFAQVGITLELTDGKASDQVKQLMPSIRNSILLMISQRTTESLLRIEGKEELAKDIQREVGRQLGYRASASRSMADDEMDGVARRAAGNPVRRVLFSSFIIQ